MNLMAYGPTTELQGSVVQAHDQEGEHSGPQGIHAESHTLGCAHLHANRNP